MEQNVHNITKLIWKHALYILSIVVLSVQFVAAKENHNNPSVKRKPSLTWKSLSLMRYRNTLLSERVENVSLTGQVLDEFGEPLPGVSVFVKGTSIGTTTDANGMYKLDVPDGSTIAFSFLGYTTQEIVIGNRSVIDVTMEADIEQLQEVIVVGYGSVEKRDVTGAITSISGNDVNETKESHALSALAGKAAGVDIRFTTNAPGTSPEILIRGRSSLNFSNAPLIVVDGIPVSSELADFNPNDIESIEVLKDASSAAIYGARGANGVVLITTKRGKVGKTQISYDTYYGFSEPFERVPMMNAGQWLALRLEALRTVNERQDGVEPGTLPLPTVEDALFAEQLEAYNAGIDTDWQDLFFQNGIQQNHQVGVLGGNEAIRYNVSANYFQQEGIIKDSEFERFTVRTNLDVNATSKLKLGISQQVAFSNRENRRSGSTINTAFQGLPLARPFEEDGVTPTTDPLGDGAYWNPLNDLVDGAFIDNDKAFNYFANIFATYQFNEHFKYTVNFGPELRFLRENDFRGTLSTSRRGGLNEATKRNRAQTSYTIENLFNYNITFNDVHKLDALFLFSAQDIRQEENDITVRDIPSETQTFNNLGAAGEIRGTGSSLDKERWTSFMARFNYEFMDKYLVTFTGRYDGSSKLAAGNKWGFFPSGSVAWRLNEEGFIQNVQKINDLKLRIGYGTVGRNPIDPFSTQGRLFRTEGSFGDNPAFGFRPGEIANPELEWEVTTTFDVGLDYGLLNNRITGSIDYYNGRTSGLLLRRQIPITSGFGNVLQNVGETENSGIELVLNTTNIQTDNFTWTTSFNFSRNRSKIVKLLDREDDDIGNRWFIGEQLAVHYDQVFDGIWQLDEAEQAESFGREVGQVKLADLNDDGVLNDDDRQIIGFVDPQWTGGLTNTWRYKGLGLTVVALTRQGHTIRSRAIFANNSLVGRSNNVNINYWTPENPSNSYPRPDDDRQGPRDEGTINYFDGSYIRIRNITLSYDFSRALLNAIGLQKLRIYATAQNPFLFRADDRLVDGVDPDVASSGSEWLPSPRTFLLGLNLTL